MTADDLLLKFTGGSPLLSQTQLAGVLDRSPDGLRMSLAGDNDLARRLKPAKRKIGKRVYFAVLEVAKVLDEAVGEVAR